MNIKLPDGETTERVAGELLKALVNLRYHSKIWHDEGGYKNKLNKNYWENKSDELLASLGTYEKLYKNEPIVITTEIKIEDNAGV